MGQYAELAEAERRLEEAMVNWVLTRIRYTHYHRNLDMAPEKVRVPKRVMVKIQSKLDQLGSLR